MREEHKPWCPPQTNWKSYMTLYILLSGNITCALMKMFFLVWPVKQGATLTAWPGQHHTTASPVSVCLRFGCDAPFPLRHNKHTRTNENGLEVLIMYFVTVTVTQEGIGSYLSEWFLARLGCRSCSTSKMLGCRKNATILSLYAGK